MDSRTSSILLNLDLNLDKLQIADKYTTSAKKVEESAQGPKIKSYKTLTSTIKECYLTGSLTYGSNFVS